MAQVQCFSLQVLRKMPFDVLVRHKVAVSRALSGDCTWLQHEAYAQQLSDVTFTLNECRSGGLR